MGLSPLISKEICYLSVVDIDRPIGTLSEKDIERLFATFADIVHKIKIESFQPTLIKGV